MHRLSRVRSHFVSTFTSHTGSSSLLRLLSAASFSSSTSEPLVLVKDDGKGIATLTLNRPRNYNALSIETMEEMLKEINQLHENKNIKVVIIKGAGKGFCAGHDLKELKQNRSHEFYNKTFNLCAKMMLSIINLPQPTIAQVHGIATAAGCQLVATCDLAVAEENAKFATPGVNIGLFCSTPMVALTRNISRKHSMEMLLLGDLIPASRALEMGLINRVVPLEKLEEETHKMALQISKKSPYVLKIGKKAFYKQADLDLESAYKYCSEVMTENMLARDGQEGISAFLEKRDPKWSGS